MRKRVSLRLAFSIGLIVSPTAAFAAAWTLNAGDGQAIVTATPSEGTQIFDQGGKLLPFPRYSKDDAQALIEYGATDWLTIIAAPSLQHVSVAAPYEGQRTGLGYTDLGARARVWTSDSWVVSVQTIFSMPGTSDRTNTAAIGYYDPQIDNRALLGYSFKAGAWPAFVDIEVAERFRLDGPPSEFHGDATFGIRPLDKWLILAQSFNVLSEGAGTWGIPSYTYYKFQLSAVYALTPAVSLQFGAFTTYAGTNALQQNGLVAGAWYRF